MLNWVTGFYRRLNILSLDVTAGAMICASFFAHLNHVHIRMAGLTALGLSVWLVYTIDHLLDAWFLKQTAATERHSFHQKYFKGLCIIAGIVVVINCVLILFIRPVVFQWGVALSLLVAMYLLTNRYLDYLKEFFVALLYCFGIFLPTMSQMSSISLFLLKPETVCFLALALTNLLLFSWFDVEHDKADGHHSFALHFGDRLTRKVIGFLFIALAMGLLYNFFVSETSVALTCLAMFAVLLMLFIFPQRFRHGSRYRLIGDAVFLLPLLTLLYGR